MLRMHNVDCVCVCVCVVCVSGRCVQCECVPCWAVTYVDRELASVCYMHIQIFTSSNLIFVITYILLTILSIVVWYMNLFIHINGSYNGVLFKCIV